MTNQQNYCDHCSERIISFADKLTVSCRSIGVLTLDICLECAQKLHKQYTTRAYQVKQERQEPLYLGDTKEQK